MYFFVFLIYFLFIKIKIKKIYNAFHSYNNNNGMIKFKN